jgi:uncharacterized damage-inducible protein DinB
MRFAALLISCLTFGLMPGTLLAQDGTSADSPAVNTARMLWEPMIGYITTAAEELPEATYSYRPTPEVRTFGQLIGHVAGAQYLICAAALGEPAREEDAIEKTRKTKAELVAALKASTEYCSRAYAQSDKATQAKTKLFGQERSRLYALGVNATHDAEHYGNIVTYLRLNKVVPPSSRQRS